MLWSRYRNRSGFSLIELLIVISLMALLVSLISPASIKMYDRFANKLEAQEISRIVKKISYIAFIREQKCEIKIVNPQESNDVALLIGSCEGEEIVTTHLGLDVQKMDKTILSHFPMIFNKKGFVVENVDKNSPGQDVQ